MYKGINPDVDSYSAFFDNVKTTTGIRSGSTGLDSILANAGVKTVVISGVATDYCVGSTALDALSLNFTTFVVDDLTRGVVNVGINAMRSKIISSGGIMVQTARQAAMDSARWAEFRLTSAAVTENRSSCE